jgi:cell division protease FtsH
VSSCYEKAKDILTKHCKDLELIAENPLEFETLTGDEIKDILSGKKIIGNEIDNKEKVRKPSL